MSNNIEKKSIQEKLFLPSFTSCVSHRFKCIYCPYSSDVSTNVKNHILTHTKERKFKCLYCEMKFTLKHHLKNMSLQSMMFIHEK
ncbi:hypothetical protein CEXT_150631 [Caerostris extrusa]|uniref:C2H2-type domain-containing protein n=1 Tax=Caerostris extrusa TaxID=172846 RepID=A0AAV4QDL2_CAEEX|nr:hypothetical protein CEXT_150631 [Caerostris extrusa]